MGFDPIWLGVMIAVNLQTSFLTALRICLFYLRGVAGYSQHSRDLYRCFTLCLNPAVTVVLMWRWPNLVLWLPGVWGDNHRANLSALMRRPGGPFSGQILEAACP